VAAWLALWARRSRPTAVAVGTLLASIVSATAAGPALLAAFSAAARAPRRGVVATAVVAVVAAAAFPLIYPTAAGYGTDLVLGESLTAVAIGWGLFVRARRQLVYSLRERAERLETEQRLKVAQAREAERRRIAGEMHDVLAHRVSLLSVHAGALEFRPDAPPEEIAEAAGVIRASAHSVLQELREVIGVLGEGGTEDDLARPSRRSPTSRRWWRRRERRARTSATRSTCPATPSRRPCSAAPPTASCRRASPTRASTRPRRRSRSPWPGGPATR
jgi:signal transduction histidine kinase